MGPFQDAVARLREQDERLGIAIDAVGPCRLEPANRTPYEALIHAIAHQQVHGRAAAAILGRVRGLYGGRTPLPAELLDTPESELRAAGLSRSKLLAMRDVAARTLDGTVPEGPAIALLSDAEIIDRLVAVRGVGRWTAEMLLIFTLGRPDVLPVDDFGVRLGFKALYGKRQMPKPKWLATYGERWAPYRSVVAWYLWRYVDWLRAEGRDPSRRVAKVRAVATAKSGAKAKAPAKAKPAAKAKAAAKSKPGAPARAGRKAKRARAVEPARAANASRAAPSGRRARRGPRTARR